MCFALEASNICGTSPYIRVDYQRLLLDHLDLIDQIVRTTGRRRYLSAFEQEDFAGFVKLRLLEDDYAILRKFQGRSSMWTYLATVIERLSFDFCTALWGRWRPSAKATALGPVAILLEQLVSRDEHSVEEAMEILRTNHAVELSFGQLRAIWEQLPVRSRTTEVGEEAAAGVSAADSSESNVDDDTRKQDIERLESVLGAAFAALAPRDRLMIALRFDHELSVSEIATALNSSVPTVHRRLDSSLKELRKALSRSGIDPRAVSGLIGHSTMSLSPLLRAEVEKFPGSVRLFKRDG